jgi:hypothetical protein
MSKSFALLTIATFALSAPINARTLSATGETDESLATAGVPADSAPPACKKESAGLSTTDEATGGMPDTEAAAAGAQTTACCWVFYLGRWWCMQC